MTPLTVVAIAFVLSLLLFGLAFWTPIYAIPLVIVFLVGLGFLMLVRRRGAASGELRQFRAEAGKAGAQQETHFTERDRQTLS